VTATLTTAPATIRVGPADIHPMREAEVVDLVLESATHEAGGLLITPNVDHLRQLDDDGGGRLSDAYERAVLVVPDGQPLLWAARVQGTPLPERVAGSNLLWSISAAAAGEGVPVLFLGGEPGAAAETAARLVESFPALRVAGAVCPTVSELPPDEEIRWLAHQVATTGATIVFLALGTPKQEVVGAQLAELLPDVWFIGVGGAFKMACGRERRAPVFVQRLGLEWCFRLVQDPRHLARRYLVHDLPFTLRLLLRAVATRFGRRRRRVRVRTV
jgi:N-acetylglucosaminyldiphosphoundecaprenol N-acetyl-beta-D-mannosaminyltransferase